NLALYDVKPREWGWITIEPGYIKNVERKSILVPSQMQSEKSGAATGNPDQWLQRLKRQLKQVLHRSVLGRNILTGETAVYKWISYTDKAAALLDEGVIWKDRPDSIIEFGPLPS